MLLADVFQEALCDGAPSISVDVSDQLVNDTTLTGVDLTKSILVDVVFSNVYFEYMDIEDTVFKRCTFIDCYFHKCSIKRTKFIECSPVKPSFGYTCVRDDVVYLPTDPDTKDEIEVAPLPVSNVPTSNIPDNQTTKQTCIYDDDDDYLDEYYMWAGYGISSRYGGYNYERTPPIKKVKYAMRFMTKGV